MRIGLVITELNPGGAELCLTELALYLAERTHQVRVWSLGPAPGEPQRLLLGRLQQAGIQVEFGDARGQADAWRISRWLRRGLDQFQPNVVQSMLWHANIITGWALWTRPFPWVAGMRVSEPRSGRWWLERWISRRMQHMVCVSRDVLQHAVQRQRLSSHLVSVITNGIRLPTADQLTLPASATSILPGQVPRLIFVGRLDAQKGVQALAERLPEIFHRLPGWSLTILGQGPLEPLLRQRVREAGLEAQVQLVGWQTNPLAWMHGSQILILPALYEGMPNVLLEAMATARPFVAFAVDGVEQLIRADEGFPSELAQAQIAAPSDWSQFIQRVVALADDEHLRTRCGQANQQHVQQHFRLEDQLRKYELLYQRLGSEDRLNSSPQPH